VFALTGVCEGNRQSVGVAEAFAKRRNNGLLGAISQLFSTLFVLPNKISYHNERAEAAEDQTPENGGLVARGPVDVLARRGPESDGRHDVCVVRECVFAREAWLYCRYVLAVDTHSLAVFQLGQWRVLAGPGEALERSRRWSKPTT
jgi:hypothetical protein